MEEIFLRRAVESDAEFLYKLANDTECRNNSLNSKKITLDEHMNWLYKTLHSETKRQYILMAGKKPVGQGRLEAKEKKCRISYSIIPECRGCGYGKILIQLLSNMVINDFPECVSCFGEVIKRNVASQKIFEDTGYIAEERNDYFYYYKSCVESCKVVEELIDNSGGGYCF